MPGSRSLEAFLWQEQDWIPTSIRGNPRGWWSVSPGRLCCGFPAGTTGGVGGGQHQNHDTSQLRPRGPRRALGPACSSHLEGKGGPGRQLFTVKGCLPSPALGPRPRKAAPRPRPTGRAPELPGVSQVEIHMAHVGRALLSALRRLTEFIARVSVCGGLASSRRQPGAPREAPMPFWEPTEISTTNIRNRIQSATVTPETTWEPLASCVFSNHNRIRVTGLGAAAAALGLGVRRPAGRRGTDRNPDGGGRGRAAARHTRCRLRDLQTDSTTKRVKEAPDFTSLSSAENAVSGPGHSPLRRKPGGGGRCSSLRLGI